MTLQTGESFAPSNTINGRIITGWQINLSHRLGQVAKEPGTYYFRLEVRADGRKVLVLMDGKDEVLGK